MAEIVVDAHIHPKMAEAELLAEMQAAGVTHGVLLAVDTDPADMQRPEIRNQVRYRFLISPVGRQMAYPDFEALILRKLQPKVTNAIVAQWTQKYPERFIGLGSVDLSKDAAYVEARLEEIDHLGLRGIKLLPFAQFYNPAQSENFRRLCRYCEETGKVILQHTGCGDGPWEIPELSQDCNPMYLRPALEQFHQVPIILGHLGSYSRIKPGIWLDEALNLAQDFPNVWGDLAAVPWLLEDERIVDRMRETIGLDRVLFASDYPAGAGQVSVKTLVELVRYSIHLSNQEKSQILGLNAARLYGLSAPADGNRDLNYH
jgi:predicted TIM-barrel fold metal-dependent hydrolase